MKPNMTHLALHVADVEACIGFYSEYCGMRVIHERPHHDGRLVWMAESGRETSFIFVMIPGGRVVDQADDDYGHLGFALSSREAVDQMATKARDDGCLVWEAREEPWPVGYYIGVRDPNGRFVEFSYGQPLGPGADLTTD